MEALARLAGAILGRHPIPARNVVGHADVAPERKEDPGELFDWHWLAAQGIGLWPEGDAPASNHDAVAMLARWGYHVAPRTLAPVVTAFQRHFRPALCDGVADSETIGRLAGLLALLAGEP
jgi:N-acetylmuramoyl-L-alanine amidase